MNLLLCLVALCSLAACSTKKNTRMSRFYQSMTTRFNVYFNGSEAYKRGCESIEDGNQDNYLQVLPLYPIGNQNTVGTGSGDFERAIEKSQKAVTLHSIKKKPKKKAGRSMSAAERKYRSRIEFNPYLHHAWMLMGKAQFQKGDFPEAAATFAYVARLYETQPEISAEARLRLAECYTLLGWYYDAEDALQKANNDSLPAKLLPAYAKAYGNLLLGTQRYREAIPQLQTIIKNEKRKKQKAREYYLLGQIYQLLGEQGPAYQAFGNTIKMSPPYQLEISARIRQTEVMASQNSEKTIKKLRKMAKKEKNKDYLDQIYYALGNVYLSRQDTVQAIKEYKTGVEKSTQAGPTKGIIDLTLGNLCWLTGEYADAQTAYNEAISLLGQDHKDYKQLTKRSKVLDELVPYTSSIALQDSLQHLASLDSAARMVVIDTLIARFVQQEEAAKKAAEKAERDQLREENMAENPSANRPDRNQPSMPTGDKSWYFYNTQLVSQGKAKFESLWGKRKPEDNWRRKNKTVVALDDFEEVNYDEEEELSDSLNIENAAEEEAADTTVVDEKNPLFYLRQIPLTEEAMAESNRTLSDALFNAGVICKDKLEDFPLADQMFGRLIADYPDFALMDQVYYHLFLMKGRMKQMAESELYKQTLNSQYPESEFTKIVTNPDFVRDAIYGKHLEDSLYIETYQKFLDGDLQQVVNNADYSAQKYPLGAHRPKFLFLHAAVALQQNDQQKFLSELKSLVQEYPENEITDLAAHILKGVQEGRLLASGSTMFGNIWARRGADADTTGGNKPDSIPSFSAEPETPYLFVLAYEEGKVNENQLLYEIANYNFSTFMVKNFDLSFEHLNNIGRLVTRVFMNYEEALYYQRQLYADPHMNERLNGMKALLISEENYKLLNEYYSFDEYEAFYKEHFAPIDNPEIPIDGSTLDEPLMNLPEEEETPENQEDADENYDEEEEEGDYYEDDDSEETDDDTIFFF